MTNYPLHWQTFACGTRHWRMQVPDAALLPDAWQARRAADAHVRFPYWAQVWPSARALSCWLLQRPQLVAGKRVWELGAGLGLPGLAIAPLAAQVCITDYEEEAVALCEFNANQLQLTQVQCRVANWHQLQASDMDADVVLLSDVNYDAEDFESLLRLLKQCLLEGMQLVLATPQRLQGAAFASQLKPWIQETAETNVEDSKGQNTTISIWLLAMPATS